MICSNCNTMNADGMKFCGNCGAPLGSAQPGLQMQQGGMQYRQPPQQAQGQPQMQPGYGPQMQPGYAPPAGNNKGGGLKTALIAVCSLLAVAVVVLALVLTGVIGGEKNSGDGKTDAAQSNEETSRGSRGGSDSTKTVSDPYQDEAGVTAALDVYAQFLEDYPAHPAKGDNGYGEEDLPEYVRFSLVYINDDIIPELAVANGTNPWNPVHLFSAGLKTKNRGGISAEIGEYGFWSMYGEMYYIEKDAYFSPVYYFPSPSGGAVYSFRMAAEPETVVEWEAYMSDGTWLIDGKEVSEEAFRETVDQWMSADFRPVFGERPVYLDEVSDIRAALEKMAAGEIVSDGGGTDEALLVNRTASDIITGSAWLEPHRLISFASEQGNGYVSFYYDELRLMNGTDNPGTRSFMQTYADEESGYCATMEAQFLQEEENLRTGTVTGEAILLDETTLFRNDSRILSFMTHHNTPFDAAGGRVGLWEDTLETFNIDAQTGDALLLSDVVTDTGRLSELASDALIEKCRAIVEAEPYMDDAATLIADEKAFRETVRQLLAGEYMNADAFFAWSPAYLGLRMVFVTETVGIAYPSGYWTPPTMEIVIPYSSAQDLFAQKWTELPENFIVALAFDTEYRFDFGAGVRTIRISGASETEQGVPCTVRIDNQDVQTIDPPGDSFYDAIGLPSGYLTPVPAAAYLVRQNESHFLWVQYEIVSAIGDYYCLMVYAVEDDTLRKTGSLNEGITRLTPVVCPDLFYVGHQFNPFWGDGGYFGMENCYVGEDGIPVLSGLGYTFYGTGPTYPTYQTRVPLNLRLADGFEPVAVPVGTLFTMSATDGETWVSFETEMGIFYLELGESGQLADIDGYSVDEAFEYVSGY
ncbi:MAG: zinc ribbon domain-containing protein [Lachnospiraceae bacterium]|nr:zinc ribbon domain-containing protein [Lachnospiraceae bacterium]